LRALSSYWPTAILALLLCVGCEQAPTSREEAAERTLLQDSWVADAKVCPVEFVPGKRMYPTENHCKGEGFSGCYLDCKRGGSSACYWLANEFQASHRGEFDSAANVLYQRSCRLGVVSGCTNRAAGLMSSDHESHDILACTAKTFLRTCELDDAWGCTMAAMQMSRGIGIEANPARALELLEKSCIDGEESEACLAARNIRDEIHKAMQGANTP